MNIWNENKKICAIILIISVHINQFNWLFKILYNLMHVSILINSTPFYQYPFSRISLFLIFLFHFSLFLFFQISFFYQFINLTNFVFLSFYFDRIPFYLVLLFFCDFSFFSVPNFPFHCLPFYQSSFSQFSSKTFFPIISFCITL